VFPYGWGNPLNGERQECLAAHLPFAKDDPMLVLARRLNEKILFPGIHAAVRVLDIRRGVVRLGIDAPPDVTILREEVQQRQAAWATAPVSAPTSVPPTARLSDAKLQDASVLLGVARLQLQVGFIEAAQTTLEQARQELEALRRDAGGAVEVPDSRPAWRRKALLVEDNANERELLAHFLRQAGLDVDTAGDGADALDYLHRGSAPDVVLLDMGLPRCDGPTAIREIRRDPRTAGLKVFAVTGHSQEDFDVSSGPDGVNGWFHKPVDPETLIRCLSEELIGSS
jgi:two-component system, OmpR family, response regulator